MTARSPLTRLLNLVVGVNLALVFIAQAVPAGAAAAAPPTPRS